MGAIAPILPPYTISGPLLSQNPPSAPDLSWGANTANITVNVWDFGPLGTSITPQQTGGLPTFATKGGISYIP